ncbi:MAG TPA: SpoIIE family protein phosphatase [Acidimicrobiales bacterium]|nr:SpoIIE family protein phosphatase [Acidimicrobiales bacterium]
MAELAIARLEAERERLESMVVRLGSLAAQLDAATLVQGVTEAARELTDAELAMFVPTERASVDEPTVICDPGRLAEVPEPARVPLLAGVIWRDSPLRLDDAAQWGPDRAAFGRLADGRRLRSWVGASVRARHGDALGGLFLAHPRAHAFGRREEELAQGLAAHLGASLDNATLFQERSRVARALQQTLLPPVLPEVDHVDIAARYRPAKSTALVGGDFYDLFEAKPGTWSFMIGDVSGVGPEAAALTGIARYAARALAVPSPSPRTLLSQLNDTLVRFGLNERFCTLFYGELRRCRDMLELRVANGGHPYPIVLHHDGRLEELVVKGPLLGLLPDATFCEAELELAPGDALICYTDGVTEARDPAGNFFGTEGLVGVLAGCNGRPAASVARRVELAVMEHQAGMAPDDIAIVVLQATHPRALRT